MNADEARAYEKEQREWDVEQDRIKAIKRLKEQRKIDEENRRRAEVYFRDELPTEIKRAIAAKEKEARIGDVYGGMRQEGFLKALIQVAIENGYRAWFHEGISSDADLPGRWCCAFISWN